MIKLPKTGKARAVGVSNFSIEHVSYRDCLLFNDAATDFPRHTPQIEGVSKATGVVPAVNQIERHPRLQQPELIEYAKQKGVHITAYSVSVLAINSKCKLVY